MFKKSFIALLLIISGCGYTLIGSGTVLPDDVRKIYIPNVQNLSSESILAITMTEALKEQFERYGVVSVVDTEEDADATLEVVVKKLTKGTRTSTGVTDTALQQDAWLQLSGTLTKKSSNEKLWQDQTISVTKSFASTKDVLVSSSAGFAGGGLSGADIGGLSERELSRGQERETITALAEQAAKRIYEDAIAADF